MPKLTFYPVDNADSCLIELENDQLILIDYANLGDPENKEDLRIDLESEIKATLAQKNRDSIDVVAFTHLDLDHIGGASDIFYLEHAAKYQDGDRIKIDTLWVPASTILEEGTEDEARIIRAEARYRFKKGKGVRVFSRPQKLEAWLNQQGLTLEDRKHLITDAGKIIPEFTTNQHGVEFFVHSPFAKRLNDKEIIDRNSDCIVIQATFLCDDEKTKVILTGDIPHEGLSEIVNITKYHNNEHRLEWNIYAVPHHCSYLSLASTKGTNKTQPTEEIKWLLEEQGQQGGTIVSSSKIIPNEDTTQPPHRQAAKYYQECADKIDGEFLVTMEHSNKSAPKPLVINIDRFGATVERKSSNGVPFIISNPSPRAGSS
jgi:beta-lactamase superfamily II metal-dependent hydrolase